MGIPISIGLRFSGELSQKIMKNLLPYQILKKSALKHFQQKVSDQEMMISKCTSFIKEVENGNLDTNLIDHTEDKTNPLAMALLSMRDKMKLINEEEQKRNWVTQGLAQFAEILRIQNEEIQEVADKILSSLVKYLNANQGAIFILNDDDSQNKFLELIGCYAYNKKKYLNKSIGLGEGLVGQAFLEKETVYLTEVPEDYVTITSGLGEALPKNILIVPLKINETVYGVLEIASFSLIEPYQLEFLEKLSESIASTFSNTKVTQRTKILLDETQQQAEELRAQEEEMRQNLEEMQSTQEELSRKNKEIEKSSAESKSILNGINATMATIEFTPEGNIISANENFLNTVKFSLHEIQGKHHQIFVPQEILESREYQSFWQKLASGTPTTGVFKRINSEGEMIWLNAIYNPIFDAEGKVTKVVKFATDVTHQQKLKAENEGIIQGINATMATIEFTPEGNIISANENFLNTVKFSLQEIQGKHHQIFVPQEILESKEYQSFWQQLAAGTPTSGVFKRKNSEGQYIWLNAIYNPIFDADGKVMKVVKLATDVTRQTELQPESLLG